MRLVSLHRCNFLTMVKNLVPAWTGTQFMMEGDLHFRVTANKLNPDLVTYIDLARDELKHAWDIEVPRCDGKFIYF
jgi:hypothetical protein